MINVLYALNGVFHKGGTEAVVLNYYKNIDTSKFHIDFLVHGYEKDCKNNAVHKYIKSCGSKIYYVTPRGVNYIKNRNEINQILKENKYDIVHSHMDAAGTFFLKIAKKNQVKLKVAHSHNTDNQINKGNFLKNILYKIVLNKARNSIVKYSDLKLACSKKAGEWLFGKNNFFVISNAIETKKFRFNQEIRDDLRKQLCLENKFIVGHIGRFCYQKNHDFLIDIFHQLKKKKGNAVLMLIGDGELFEETKNKVKSLNIENSVIFLGSVNDAYRYYQAMDVFLLPSRYEGLPVVSIEAKAAGLPLVMSSEVTNEAKILDSSYFVNTNDSVDKWAEVVLSTQKHRRKDTCNELKNAGFNIETESMKLTDLYSKLLLK